MNSAITRRTALGALLAALWALTASPAMAIDFPDWYTLAEAARHNNLGAVKYLLSERQDPNFVDSTGHSPLDYAAILGNVEMIDALIDGAARVDYRDKIGSTPLHWVDELYPSGIEDVASERTRRSREQTKHRIVELFVRGETQGNAPGTKWAAINAIIEHSDWLRPLNAGSQRFARVLDDGGRKTHALELVSAA